MLQFMHILFIGNSYTFYNEVPAQVVAFGTEAKRRISEARVVEGGASWTDHIGRLGALEAMERGVFSHVVLQNRSHSALLEEEAFHRDGDILAKAVRELDAQPVFYQTWAWHEEHPCYQDGWSGRSKEGWHAKVEKAYASIAARHGANVAPVGAAWLRALREYPELRLHDEDNQHASPLGSYLAACVLAETLGLGDIQTFSFAPSDVDPEAAKVLRQVAHQMF